MIVGIGVDVCSIARWQAMVERRPAVVDRVLTPDESGCNAASQAARFAAKEALAKALGAPGGLNWLDVKMTKDSQGSPRLEATGTVAARARVLGVTRIHVSVSHDAGIAAAFVVCEGHQGQ